MADEFRVLINHRGNIYKIFKLAVTDEDASLYIFPYSKSGKYFGGVNQIGRGVEGEHETQIDLDEQFSIERADVPKVSIHQSGQVHTLLGGHRIGPLQMGKLAQLRDEHIATVTVDQFAGLPKHEKSLKTSDNSKKRDIPIEIPENIPGGRFRIYVNGVSNQFGQTCNIRLQLNRRFFVALYSFAFRLPLKED